MRREIGARQLLQRRLTVAVALRLHPGVVDPSRPLVVGSDERPGERRLTPEARRFADLLEERPELVVSMTELLDRLDGVIEGSVVDGGA